MIHYYIIFYSYLPKLNSQLFSYQIWAGRKSQFFFPGSDQQDSTMLHICIQYYSTSSRYILLDVHCWWKKSCTPWVVLLLTWCSINDTFMNTYQWTRKPWKCEDEIFFSFFFYFLAVHEIGSKRLNSSPFPTHSVSRLPCQEHDHEEEEMAESSPSKEEAVHVKPEPTPEEKEPEM